MSIVAIAGGTSASLGRAITTAILEQYPDGRWKPMILSRSTKRPLWLRAVDPQETRVEIVAVDYASVDSIKAALVEVHTLLSVVLAKDGSQSETLIRLLSAAVDSGVKRYVPSYWGVGVDGWDKVGLLKTNVQGVWDACLRSEHHGNIKVARFNHGMHMNYTGIGARDAMPDQDQHKLLESMQRNGGYAEGDDIVYHGVDKDGDMADQSGAFLISPSSCTAEMPMTEHGGYPSLTMTTIRDVGRFVAAALDLEEWQHDMNIAGDKLPLDEILRIVETVKKRKFDVKKLSARQLQDEISGLQMPQDMMKGMWLELKLMVTRNAKDEGILDGVVNRMCAQVQPTMIQEYIEQAWAT